MLERKKSFEECNFNDLCCILGDSPKTVQQRMRRAIKTGLTNLAHIGIEDYYNESFQEYSKGMFDFASVKAEMDYIKGKNKTGGKVIISKFFEGLLLQWRRLLNIEFIQLGIYLHNLYAEDLELNKMLLKLRILKAFCFFCEEL